MSEKNSKILWSKKRTKIYLSHHVQIKLKTRFNSLVQGLMKQPKNQDSMVINTVNRLEKNLTVKELTKKIRANKEVIYVVHNYCMIKDYVLDQAIIFVYTLDEDGLKITVVSYCWQLITLNRFLEGKYLYRNKEDGMIYHKFIRIPHDNIPADVICRLQKDYKKLSSRSRMKR